MRDVNRNEKEEVVDGKYEPDGVSNIYTMTWSITNPYCRNVGVLFYATCSARSRQNH